MGQRAGKVLAQVTLRILRFAICDRPENKTMVPKDGYSLARCRKVKSAQPVKMATLPADKHP